MFCDFCRSAGGLGVPVGERSLPFYLDPTWANAFNIALPGVDPFLDRGTFQGWNGDAIWFAFPNGDLTTWYWFGHWDWSWLEPPFDASVLEAFYHAATDAMKYGMDEFPNPWDFENGYCHWQMFGDPLGTAP